MRLSLTFFGMLALLLQPIIALPAANADASPDASPGPDGLYIKERDQLYKERDQIYKERDQIYKETRDQIYKEARDQIYKEARDQIYKEARDQIYKERDGLYKRDGLYDIAG